MLRAQAFEGLFTLVPIFLVAVVSIFLRARASRRRKQREEAVRDGSASGEPARSARSAPARGASARSVQAQGAPAQVPQGKGVQRQGKAAGGKGARAAQFPWQRETSKVYPKRSAKTPYTRGATAVESFVPQQPDGFPVTSRESYPYPLPLALDQAGPQQVVRPSLESLVAVERMAPPGRAQDLQQRMQALDKPERPSTKAADGRGSSIAGRLERLPPLKRAVVWAEILGPPGGRP